MSKYKINAKMNVLKNGVHYVTSKYGNRTYTNNGKKISDFHKGIDLVGSGTDYIIAAADGTVLKTLNTCSGRTPSQGNYVTIKHSDGKETVYYHMKKGSVTVKAGDKVKKGTVIGYMGSTGNVTGAHLHFGLKVSGKYVDPEPYLLGKSTIGTVTKTSTSSTKIPSTSKKEIKLKIDGTNKARYTDQLIVYDKGTSTKTNKWGSEVAVNKNGIATSDPVYGVGNMKIPSGGFVVSGHDKSSTAILDNIKKGYTIKRSNGYLIINKQTFKKGDIVKVTNPIIYGTTKKFKLYYDKYTIISINGDRAVIGINGVVTAAISTSNITK